MLATITRWRRRVGALIGGFEAGQSWRRLKHFQPSRAHLYTLIAAAGADITARARWLVRNNGYAANAIESWAGNVVGAGIKPSSLIATILLAGCAMVHSDGAPHPLVVDYKREFLDRGGTR